jgi:hypothetical protein
MVISPPSGANVHKLTDSAARVRRGRVQIAAAQDAVGATVRSSA